MIKTPISLRGHMRSMSKKKAVALMGGALAAAFTMSACTTGGGSGDGGGSGEGDAEYSTDTLRSTMTADPNSFSPFDGVGASANTVSSLLYGTLLYQDEDNTTTAGLASEYEVTPDHGVFTIREGATCSDGTEITPTVVADSLEVFVENSRQKEIVFGSGDPTITPDDAAGTVEISLDSPWIDMERGLTLTETGIVCPAGLEDLEALAAGEIEGAFSGAYALSNNQPGVSLEFELREDGYTFPEFTTPLEGIPAQTVNYAVMADYNAIANGLLTDTLDYATMLGEASARVTEEEGFTTDTFPVTAMFLMFNEREGSPMVDEEVRQAVAQAISRDAFNDAVTEGRGDILSSYVPDEVECAYVDEDAVIQQDTDAAADVLDGVSINVTGTNATGPNGAGNSYIAQALTEAGADVNLANQDNSTWATEMQSKPESWDITVMSLLNMSRTQFGGLSQFTGASPADGGRNITFNEHQDVVDRVNEAMAEEDEAARCAIYEEIQTELLEEAVFVPLSTLPGQITTREGVSSKQFNGISSAMTLRITG